MWFSIEPQATTPAPEWGGQAVRMAQEEDAVAGADGKIRWALKRQDTLFLVKQGRPSAFAERFGGPSPWRRRSGRLANSRSPDGGSRTATR